MTKSETRINDEIRMTRRAFSDFVIRIYPMVLRKLAISNFLTHRTRVALTVAAIALSVSLVVAVTSGYASAEGAAYQFLDRFIGSVDAQIGRENDSRAAMSEELAAQV